MWLIYRITLFLKTHTCCIREVEASFSMHSLQTAIAFKLSSLTSSQLVRWLEIHTVGGAEGCKIYRISFYHHTNQLPANSPSLLEKEQPACTSSFYSFIHV